ncbi:MAG: hypothetical protein LBT64_01905 [Puniceicoccales bacterium]|jgi:hypothetical protein|nr:hypothetical protein [Puniceicoccales bacterium]
MIFAAFFIFAALVALSHALGLRLEFQPLSKLLLKLSKKCCPVAAEESNDCRSDRRDGDVSRCRGYVICAYVFGTQFVDVISPIVRKMQKCEVEDHCH